MSLKKIMAAEGFRSTSALRPGLADPLIYKGDFKWKIDTSGVGVRYLVLDVGAASVRLRRSSEGSSWEINQQVASVFEERAKIKRYEGYNTGPGNWKKTTSEASRALAEYLEDIKSILETKADQIQAAINFVNSGVPDIPSMKDLK